MKINLTLLFLVLFFPFTQGDCQELLYQFENYSVNEGLPNSQVYDIIQDHEGYIWIGTDRGLAKFNGYEFEIFNTKDGLSSNVIFKIAEDEKGKIWVCGKDRNIFFFEEGEIKSFKYNDSLRKNISNLSNINSIHVTNQGMAISVWGPNSNWVNKDLYFFHPEKENSENQLNSLYIKKDELGMRIGGSKVMINQIFFNGEEVEFPFQDSIPARCISSVAQSGDEIYFSIYKSLYKFSISPSISKVILVHTFDEQILNIKVDKQDNIYLACRFDGVWMMKKNGGEEIENLIPNVSVSSIMFDNKGGIWIGTLFNGIYYNKNRTFKQYKAGLGLSISAISGNATDIIFQSGENQIFSFNNVQNRNFVFDEIPITYDYAQVTKVVNGVRFIKNLLVGYAEFEKKQSSNNRGGVWREGTLNYYCDMSISGLELFTKEGFTSKSYTFSKFINTAIPYKDSLIMFGSDNGVFFFRDEYVSENDSNYYIYPVENAELYRPEVSFFQTIIRDIKVFNDEITIYASGEKGVYVECENRNDFWIEEKDGLFSNDVEQIYIEDDFFIAIGKKGLSIINNKAEIKNLTYKNGLISNNVYDVFVRNDSLWIATDKGVSLLTLENKVKKDIPIYCKNFKIGNKNIIFENKVNIPYDENSIEISYEGISYEQERDIQYKYKLLGLDNRWIKTKNRKIRYSNLPAGNFSFWIKAENIDKTWTTPICLINIEKPKPFWEELWFFILLFVIFIWILWFLLNKRYVKLKKEQEDKLIMLNMERKTLQAQMHPHFVFNSLTSLQSLIIDDKKFESQEYLGRFAKLTRLALNHSTKNEILLREEIELLEHYIELEKIRYGNKFTYEIKNELDHFKIMIPPMLIQPFVENALIHGLGKKKEKGLLKIEFRIKDADTFFCIIKDDGVGRTNNVKRIDRKSLGIHLVKKRLSILLNLEDEKVVQIKDLLLNNEPVGTEVKLILPFKKSKK